MPNVQQQIEALEWRIGKLEKQMSAITTYTAQIETILTDLKSDIANIQTGIANLNAQIVALQASPTLAPADAAALQQLVTDGSALQSTADNVSAEFPTPPTPPAA